MIRSILTWVFAPLFLLIGSSMTLAGIIFATSVGPDDTASLSRFVVPEHSSVLTADLVSTGSPGTVGQVTYGTYHLTFTHVPADTFVGVAGADDVDHYLGGAAVSNAGIVIPLLSSLHQEGTGGLPSSAAAQRFWVAKAPQVIEHGTRLDWDIHRGSFTVLASSPGASGLAGSTLDISVTVPGAFVSTVAVAIVGGLIAGGSILAMITAVAALKRRSVTAVAPKAES